MPITPKYDSKSIKQKSQLEHIRDKSTMYLGGATDLDADCQLLKEIVDNSADESLDPNRIYQVRLLFFRGVNRYQACVIDHGRGIPCAKLKTVYTEGFTSGKYDDQAYNGISTGTFGIGSKCTAGLSDHFLAISNRPDGFAGLTLAKGVVEDNKVFPTPINAEYGMTVLYEPDQSILEESAKYLDDPRGLERSIHTLEYIGAFKPNTKFTVEIIDGLVPENFFTLPYQDQWTYLHQVKGTPVFATPDNITPYSYAKNIFEIPGKAVWRLSVSKALDVANSYDTVGYNVDVGLTKDLKYGILGSVNFNVINNPTGSHLQVFQDHLKKRLVDYLDDENKELKTFFLESYKLPIHGSISAYYKGANFIGQSKDNFKDSTFSRIYGVSLDKEFAKLKDKVFEELFDLIADDIGAKFAQATNRTFNTGKSLKNAAFQVSRFGTYVPCAISSPEITELLITEGNSAGDYAKMVRDPNFQAIMMLGGKPLNAIKSSNDKMLENKVYMDLMRLCGVSPRDKDLRNFNFKSIGLLADADSDGYHIICLLLGCLHQINPLILESGRVWIANPPLYAYTTKDSSLFLRDQKALNDARVEMYNDCFEISLLNVDNQKKAVLSGYAFRDFVYLVKRVGTVINTVSNKLAIDPFVLEQVTHVLNELDCAEPDYEKIRVKLNLEQCSYQPNANVMLMVSDGSEIPIPLDHLVPEIKSYIMPEVAPIHWGHIVPLVTTKKSDLWKEQPCTFMQLDKIFTKFDEGIPVTRLKGLGECDPKVLAYSCIDPATRTYTTIRGIGDVDRLYRLLGVNPIWRKELVLKRADQILGEIL